MELGNIIGTSCLAPGEEGGRENLNFYFGRVKFDLPLRQASEDVK